MLHLTTRHVILFLGAVCLLAASWPTTGRASSGKPVLVPQLAPRTLLGLDRLNGVGKPHWMHEVAPRRAPRFTPGDLRVAGSSFAPATVNPQYDYVEDNPTADANAFAQDHSTTYENLGRITGYYERADWNVAGVAVTFRYQGSLMSGEAGARVAQQDNISHQQSAFGGQLSPCPNANPPPQSFPDCGYVATQDTQQTTWIADYAWAAGSCLIETEAQFPKSLDSATQNQIETILSTFTFQAHQQATQLCGNQGGQAPTPTNTVPAPPTATATRTPISTPTLTPTPGPTNTATSIPVSSSTPTATAQPTATPTPTFTRAQVNILAVRVEKNGARADISKPPLTTVKVHQKVLLAIYVLIEQATSGMPMLFRFNVGNLKTHLVDKTTQDSAPATFPAQLRETLPVQATKKGKYTFEATVEFQGTSFQRTSVFTVAGSTKKQCANIGGAQYCTKP